MKIAIIGTGNVGGALATQWSMAGHQILLGVRDVSQFKGKHLLKNKNTEAYPTEQAIKQAEIILLAIPANVIEGLVVILKKYPDKIVIDSMNLIGKPLFDEFDNTSSFLKARLKTEYLVKCFNTTGYENIQNPKYDIHQLDMFVAGDSKEAKEIAIQLAEDAGFLNCYDVGGDDKFLLMEQFAKFWINLAIFQGMGRNIGFKLLKRKA